MKTCNMALTGRQQRLSALSSGKTDKYEYLKGDEILPPQQNRIIQETKPTSISKKIYIPLEKQKATANY